MDETTKPKRGRKPKEVSLVDDSDKKKRGRKPKSTYSVSENASAAPLCLSDDENVIVRLQVPDDDTDNILENPPCAYNKDKYNMIQGFDAIEDNDGSLPHVQDELKVMDVLKDFEEKNKNNEWPSNTSTCCYWCCHKFDNSPFGIPVNFSNGHFEVFGCFCSLECAAAYNFKDNESIDEVWERYNLINLLSRKVGLGRIVKPAPDKITLKMFGGFMDIEAFRSYSGTNKVMNVNFPPMTSLTQQIEEINEYELNSDLRYIPLDNERINRCKEKMIFKRNKPLISEKTTLESSMNVKFMN